MTTLLALSLLGCKPKLDQPPDHNLDTSFPTTTQGTDVLRFRGPVPKNLLFLSIDTFRKDHVGIHGDKGLTPFLDSIAQDGVYLNDHMQCADWTFGSTTCTLAGRYNIERGHIPRLNGTDEQRPPVPAGTPFLASWLGEAGFYSIIVSGNDWLSDNWGNTQGYDEVLKPGGGAYEVHATGTAALAAAIATGKADPWFLHMHFMEPHASYDPPADNVIYPDGLEIWPEDLTNRDLHYAARDTWGTLTEEERVQLEGNLRALYEGEIRTLDERFSIMWQMLEQAGYLDDTLVVIWNDHGEQFWEHGNNTHAYLLHPEENDGFAIFWANNIIPGVYEGPTASIDLVPTILDLHGIEKPEEVTGYVIGSAPDDRPRFAEAIARKGAVQSVQLEGLKLQYEWSGKLRFYDRNVDPFETNDIYDPLDPRVLLLWSQLKPMVEDMAPLVVGGNPAPVWPPDLP